MLELPAGEVFVNIFSIKDSIDFYEYVNLGVT